MTPERADASRRFGEAVEKLYHGGLTREERRRTYQERNQAKEDYKRALEKERRG